MLGPEKLPRVVSEVGRWVGRARAMARQFREQLEHEAETFKHAADMRSHMSSAEPPQAPSPEPWKAPSQEPRPASVPEPAASAESHERGQ